MQPSSETRQRARAIGARLRAFFVTEGWLWDWLLAAALIAISFAIPINTIPPYERYFMENDPSLSYPHVDSWPTSLKLSEPAKFALMFGVPFVVGLGTQWFTRSWVDMHHLALTALEGFAVESSFKRWMSLVGRHRPDWYARLEGGNPDEILNGKQSYPSGHAAELTVTCAITALYLMGKFRVYSHPRKGHFALLTLALLPMAVAMFVTLSRINTYNHSFSDINAGIGIGVIAAVLVYFLQYPSLFDRDCHLPRPREGRTAAAWEGYGSHHYARRDEEAPSAGGLTRGRHGEKLREPLMEA